MTRGDLFQGICPLPLVKAGILSETDLDKLETLNRVTFLSAKAFNLLHGLFRETDHSDGWESSS